MSGDHLPCDIRDGSAHGHGVQRRELRGFWWEQGFGENPVLLHSGDIYLQAGASGSRKGLRPEIARGGRQNPQGAIPRQPAYDGDQREAGKQHRHPNGSGNLILQEHEKSTGRGDKDRALCLPSRAALMKRATTSADWRSSRTMLGLPTPLTIRTRAGKW
ncbi:hypothetical protein [Haematobacter massiliensis]|uniref:hypothetical protein n=1 Tax=Haematobacter massiliensis TaxID=195105 RepID=UPI00103BEDAA|nr:hypothetical protein [Haematobacter massiliensis]QBJ25686.1 hypothetical protein HmaOT1_15215 [Haematobacter massiliensis]